MKQKHYYIILGSIAFLVTGGMAVSEFVSANEQATSSSASSTASSQENIITEIAKISPADALGLNTTSWSGEILSTGNMAIHPPREGSIAQWHVRIGDKVRQGQLLATLSLPPASTERIMALAEQQSLIVKAKLNAESTDRFAQVSRKKLETYKESLEVSRDATISATGKDVKVTPDIAVPTTLSEARILGNGAIATMQTSIRAMIQQMVEQHTRLITRGVTNPESGIGQYRVSVGMYSGQALNDFDPVLNELIQEIKKGVPISESLATRYFVALQRLILASAPSEELPESTLAELKKMAGDDRIAVLNAYADLNKEIREVRIDVANVSAEYAGKQAEVESEIAGLGREVEMANAEVRAAEVNYDEITNGLSALNVVAPRDGSISGIYEDIGHFVEPTMQIASLNTGKTRDSYIRFRIPSNATLPKAGDMVMVSRPGFALENAKAKIFGVSDTLDSNGSYQADAMFLDAPVWPIRASVRVHPNSEHGTIGAVMVPFSAIIRDDGESKVWVVQPGGTLLKVEVKTRRTIGDSVEIVEGLGEGMRFVPSPSVELRDGMSLSAVSASNEGKEAKPRTTSGHGGGHDE